MTPEQKELNRRFLSAQIPLNIAIARFDTKDKPTELVIKLREAQDTFFALHEDWRLHLGDPITIKPAVIARELRELADRLEQEDDT